MNIKLLSLIWTILFFACNGKAPQKMPPGKDLTPPLDKSLAIKPPMGWNSWDCLGWGYGILG